MGSESVRNKHCEEKWNTHLLRAASLHTLHTSLTVFEIITDLEKAPGLLTFWHRSFTFNSNKSPTWCNGFLVYYPDVCLQLKMFREFFRPSSGAQWLQWQCGVCSWSGRAAGPTTNTARLSPRYEGKTRGCHCSHWAPDDGRENARNTLRCK